MKGKVTWKPRGLHAKRWRDAAQVRGAANLLPARKRNKQRLTGRIAANQPPSSVASQKA